MAKGVILGGGDNDNVSVEADESLDLLDSEILKVEAALQALMEHQGKRMVLENFRKEAKERFAEQGFVVDVLCWQTNQPGLYAFDFKITGRCEPIYEFDHERQRYEVINDILDIDPDKKGEVMKPTESLKGLRQAAQDKH